ncbi:glutaminase [Fictibacillus macauensis ZFHKF-1]|uniref:Glutaminase n=1 Tax=Fictibacillus macauensis ZFHKF-1 TaxID=1196324 RepID=I8UIL7_9BACL|nr:glutaminase A [Fictibacillus macauensis]EIT86740.1 glutaminase [Fictibacillus macauensis ZFHKF-1]
MTCQENEQLEAIVEEAKHVITHGKVATYIPALQSADPNALAVAIYRPDGSCLAAGNIDIKFTLQSISKVLVLALALMDRGEETVFHKVGYEPTGDPFDSIIKLETISPSKPLNPMINAGALAVTHLICGNNEEEQFERLLTFVRKLSNNPQVTYCENVAHSEFETAYLNRALLFYMKQHGVITCDVEALMKLYTKQCAIEMTCRDLARIGLIFAMGGIDPDTGVQLIPTAINTICKTFMVTCGMYNASGEFAIRVGIPAKSGVSGGIMGAVPNKLGIGVYGPSLDTMGNSIGGLKMLELLSKEYALSIFRT